MPTMHKKVVYFLLSLSALWLTFVTSAVIISNGLERSDVSEPIRTGVSYLDAGIRYFESISQSGFSPVEFLSIEFWSIYVTVFLAALGAFGGLLSLYEKIRGVSQKDFSAEKRQNVLLLVCAISSSVVFGTVAVLSSVRKRYLLNKFYILEVHLVRFEGLMFNSLAISANRKLLDTFFIYMIGYFARIQKLLNDISRSYEFAEQDEISKKMHEFSGSVKELEARGYVDNQDISDIVYNKAKGDETLLGLLRNLEFMQETVRRHIRQLER